MIPSVDPSFLSPPESAALAGLPSVQTFWYVSDALQVWYLKAGLLRVRRVGRDGRTLTDRRSRI